MVMDTFKSVAHLQREIGEERFQALISSDNTEKVKNFCDQLIRYTIPTTMTVGGRAYDILGFLKGDEKSVVGCTMVALAKELSAHLGEDDGQHILKHQDEIPATLRGKIVFIFTDWRDPDDSDHVAYVDWSGGQWVQCWGWLDDEWSGSRWVVNSRVLCRK